MLTRRGVIAGAAASVAAAGVTRVTTATATAATPRSAERVPFRGRHQAGIATPQQQHAQVAAYDVSTRDVAHLAATLQAWTTAAERLTAGLPATRDSGEALGLGPARLTVTVGFGPSLFGRLGLAHLRPAALTDLPRFRGDALEPEWCGGDVVVQACADDLQVAHHAVRTLTRLAHGVLRPRWLQSGFLPGRSGSTPRNLFGFADGTANMRGTDAALLDRHVWAGAEDQAWMHGGSYLVVRRIRMRLEAWDASPLHEQEAAIGRSKATGVRLPRAPHGHAAVARPESNGGARLLRRGYAFSDGIDRAGRMDAGLLFLAFQRDPRTQFTRIQHNLSAHDEMNEYVRHVGSAVFACGPGISGTGSWATPLHST